VSTWCPPLFEKPHRTTADRGRIVNKLDSTTEVGCATLLW
jgi:hypothetical protein